MLDVKLVTNYSQVKQLACFAYILLTTNSMWENWVSRFMLMRVTDSTLRTGGLTSLLCHAEHVGHGVQVRSQPSSHMHGKGVGVYTL